MRLSIIGTGGTIASRHTDAGVVAQVPAAELLESVRGQVPAGLEIATRDVGVRPSFALRLVDMRDIAAAVLDEIAGGAEAVVVLHGTDSMEETSFLTDLVHAGPQPVVFTGAQRPFDVADGDARANMLHAIRSATDPRAARRGTLVAFDGDLWAARGVRKVHTVDLAGFAGRAVDLEGAAGPLRPTLAGATAALTGDLPSVEVVALVPGGDGRAIRDAAARGADGIVLQALGIGNAGPHDTEAAADLVADGTPVVVATRVPSGPTRPVYGSGGGADLARHGALFAGDLSPWQARVLTTLALAATTDSPTPTIHSAVDLMRQWLDAGTARHTSKEKE